MSQSKLFTPTKVGDATLEHRVVMAPLTRYRATKAHVPTPLMAEYYAQRASTRGTLLISEATFIAPQAAGYRNVPGIWSDEQVAAWKPVCTFLLRISCSALRNLGLRDCIGHRRCARAGLVYLCAAVGPWPRCRSGGPPGRGRIPIRIRLGRKTCRQDRDPSAFDQGRYALAVIHTKYQSRDAD